MADHQHDPNANALWMYFNSVITWVQTIFPSYRREMKGVAWGELYNEFHDTSLNTAEIEKEVARLMQDDDVTNTKGIYVCAHPKREIPEHPCFRPPHDTRSLRTSTGICANCHQHFEIEEMEADHITPWHAGGKTDADNCQMLCRECNRRKRLRSQIALHGLMQQSDDHLSKIRLMTSELEGDISSLSWEAAFGRNLSKKICIPLKYLCFLFPICVLSITDRTRHPIPCQFEHPKV